MHTLSPDLLRRTVRVLVVGCGGNGTAIAAGLPYLHQAMLVAGHPGGLHVTVMDGDIISPANCARQPFCRSEIGLAKAVVVVSRLNLFWGLRWTAVPEYFSSRTNVSEFDIVIGCVDTRAARALIRKQIEGWRSRVGYYLDLGNSSDTGQFVLGQPWNARNRRSTQRLRIAPEILPEIVEERLDEGDGPSCSAAEALERQVPFVNQALAYHALALLSRLFREGRIEHHGAFVDVARNRVQPLPISPELWRRMRRRGLRSRTARDQTPGGDGEASGPGRQS
ncbi:MAG: PRTRC system ThiF family protein [Bryobacterales bacterium]|nr:PRTRC system ThiF family protein [Bryobacterales bacterium]